MKHVCQPDNLRFYNREKMALALPDLKFAVPVGSKWL